MGLRLYWTEFAQKELESIYDYYRKKAGARVSKRIIEGIYNESLKLKSQAKIGQTEDFLITREEKFRYLVFKNYIIIYWINENKNRVEIHDVFDTRQSPIKIQRNK